MAPDQASHAAWNQDDERDAVEILKRHSGADVHVHGAES